MRTLTAGLLAAQEALTGTGLIGISIGGVDYSSRLLYRAPSDSEPFHLQQPYGSIANILLDNSDEQLNTADFKGDKVVITYGYSGQTGSAAPSLWVLRQSFITYNSKVYMKLLCADIWFKLRNTKVVGGGGYKLEGAITGTFQPGEVVTGGTSGAKGTVIGSGSGYLWVGYVSDTKFQAETATSPYGASIVISDTTELGGGSSPGWYGDTTIYDIISSLVSGIATLQKDSSDSFIDSYTPIYKFQAGTPAATIIQDLMALTKCAIRWENDDKLHIFSIASTPDPVDYAYDADHTVLANLVDESLVIPNRVTVIGSVQSDADINVYSGADTNDASIALVGELDEIIHFDVTSVEDAESIAANYLDKIEHEANRGSAIVPMNCGQELFDYVSVLDPAISATSYGWVGSIQTILGPGIYQLQVELG
jgi:hypothetical protein